LVDFAIAFVVLIGMMFYYDVTPTSSIWVLPLLLLLALTTALGVGLWFSAWNVHYRDINYIIPFLTQFWMLASPLAYPLSEIPEKWRLLYSLNPMVGVVEGFRWALLGTDNGLGIELWISVGIAVLLLVSGVYYFRSMERTFADTV
jgi:lipopolysaccharide transport system permease protein